VKLVFLGQPDRLGAVQPMDRLRFDDHFFFSHAKLYFLSESHFFFHSTIMINFPTNWVSFFALSVKISLFTRDLAVVLVTFF